MANLDSNTSQARAPVSVLSVVGTSQGSYENGIAAFRLSLTIRSPTFLSIGSNYQYFHSKTTNNKFDSFTLNLNALDRTLTQYS